jgi:hypothetical protein
MTAKGKTNSTRRPESRPAGRRGCGVVRIMSGGQTGADRAALDFARAHGIPHGGWCPRGRLAEDGRLADEYALAETPDAEYAQRTEWNVRDSDGTVIFSLAPELTGGSKLTAQLAARLGKPCLHVSDQHEAVVAVAKLREFVARNNIRVLNVAGPRASGEPGVARFVIEMLRALFHVSRNPRRGLAFDYR